MKCPECNREVGFARMCPYCDSGVRQTAGGILNEGTKVLIKGMQWKPIVFFAVVGVLLVAGMVIAETMSHDFGLMQWEALRRHGYWIAPLLFLCLTLSIYRNSRTPPQHTATERILKWFGYYGFLFLMALIILWTLKS